MAAPSLNVELFIEEVKQREAIWNSSHPKYRKKKYTRKMWQEIQEIFPNCSEEYLKKRFKNLRDIYRRELKKVLPEYNNQVGSDYESNYANFELLDFLRSECKPLPDNVPDYDEIKIEIEEQSFSENENDRHQTENHNSLPDSQNPGSYSTFEACTSTCSRKTKLQEETFEIERKRLKLLEVDSSSKIPEQRSDNHHFLMSLLPEMDKLHPIQSFRLRNKINQALLEEITRSFCGDPLGQ